MSDSPAPLPPRDDRDCGGCDLCCTIMAVRELEKPAFTACRHLAGAGTGCGIWGAHPPSCRGFHCLWRSSAARLPQALFPADCGFLLAAEVTPAWPMLVKVCADPRRPDAWDRPRHHAVFRAIAAAWNCPVVVVGDGTRGERVFAPSGRSYARAERPELFPDDGAGLALGLEDYAPDRQAPAERIAGAAFSWG